MASKLYTTEIQGNHTEKWGVPFDIHRKYMLVGIPSTSRPLWSHNEHLYIVMYKAGMLLDVCCTMYTKKYMLVGMPSTSRPLWSQNEHLYIVMCRGYMEARSKNFETLYIPRARPT